jgi:putative colanic acid biosynthesis acetyltransferase WcaF
MTNRNTKWPLKYKLKRFVWMLVWLFLFRPTPKRLGMKWRNFLLRSFGAKLNGSALVCASCKILEPWNLILGNGAALGERVNVYNYALVSIGDYSVVSEETFLCTGTHNYTLASHPLIWYPILIEANVWIAARCFVHPGVTIHDGAVIGACSVVISDAPAWMVSAGHPCKPLKQRNMMV